MPSLGGDTLRLDSRSKSLLLCALLASPVAAAIWFVPWFVTPDGPVHLYNSKILSLLAQGNPLFSEVYAARGGLLPYTATYKILELLLSIGPPRFADRLMMTATSLGFAGSIIWLRQRIRGWESMGRIAPLILVVSFSRLWLYGLYGFFLGACLLIVALGCWWRWRDDLGAVKIAALALILALGFFFHIVGAALAVFGVIILAIFTPGQGIRRRVAWTVLATAPTIYLVARFVLMMRGSAGGGVEWPNLNDGLSLGDWARYIQNADFISISFKSDLAGIFLVPTDIPFGRTPAYSYAVLSPFHWAMFGLILLAVSSRRGRVTLQRILSSTYRGWILIVGLLLVVGFAGPGAFGQGSLFRDRLLMLGVALSVVLVRPTEGAAMKVGRWALLFALACQSAFVCDYASISNRIAAQFKQAEQHIGRSTRVSMITADTQTHYLLTPIPEIVNQVGVDTESVVWNNYGPAYYYFPTTFRDDRVRGWWNEIDNLNKLMISGDAEAAAARNPAGWSAAFDVVLDNSDFLIVWGEAPWLDSINTKWFDSQPFFVSGNLRLFKHK